jgi:hypothetical protein
MHVFDATRSWIFIQDQGTALCWALSFAVIKNSLVSP